MSQNVWATIMPFGPVTLIFYWPKKTFSGQPWAGPHFRHWGGSEKKISRKDAKWCILLHFGYKICVVKTLDIV